MPRPYRLDNGVLLICEPMPHMRSLSVGVWVNSGARDERQRQHGLSHFLEHMHFKGTARRTARQIADAADAVGGELNAYTARESTTFYARVLGDHEELAIDLLSDILIHSRFPDEEIEREKQIILEEIRMVEDTPDDWIHDLFYATAFGESDLGTNVLGSPETVAAVDRRTLLSYRGTHYTAPNMLIAAAGQLDPERLRDRLNATFGQIPAAPAPAHRRRPGTPAPVRVVRRDLAEAHLCLGVRALSHDDPARYALFLLNTLLGSGVSSRLFQEIREKRGLAYSIYSFVSSYSDTGILAAYAGTRPSRVAEVIALILEEFARFRSTVDGAALDRAREQLKGNLLLGLESTSARMNHLARNQICFGRQVDLDEIIARIDGVSAGDVIDMARRLFVDENLTLTVLGPVAPDDITEETLSVEEVST